MIEPVVSYINSRVENLKTFATVRGLCETIRETSGGVDKTYPGFYIGKDNLKHITDYDYRQGVVFHMKNGNYSTSDLERVVASKRFIELRQPMSLYAFVRRDIYSSDDAYSADELIHNLMRTVSNDNINGLRTQLRVNRVFTSAANASSDKNQIITGLYSNVDFPQRHDLIVVRVDYTITFQGNENCFRDYGCLPAPVPPVAEFEANNLNPEPGEDVQFFDQSTNSPASWLWTFTAPSMAQYTSSDQNPSFSFDEPGSWDVELVATNEAGSGSMLKSKYITVQSGINPEVLAWEQRVIGLGGSVSPEALAAHNVFLSAISGFRNKFLRLNTLSGVSLNSARGPFIISMDGVTTIANESETNNNFISPDFLQETGLDGNGLNKRFTFGFNPANIAEFIVDDCCVGVFSNTPDAGSYYDMVAPGGGFNLVLSSRRAGDAAYFALNDQSLSVETSTDGSGLFAMCRPDANTLHFYRNGVLVATRGSVALGKPAAEMEFAYDNRFYFGYFIARSLTPSEHTILYSAWQTLNTALGR